MKKNYIYGLLAMLLMAACTTEELTEPQPETQPEPAYRQGELFVKVTPEVGEMIESVALTTRGTRATRSGALALDEVLDLINGYELERVFPCNSATEARTRECGLHLWYVVRFSAEQSVEEVAASMQRLGEVQKIDFNRTLKRAYTGKATPLSVEKLARMTATRATTSDPLFEMQWNLLNRGDMFVDGAVAKSVKDADVQVEKAWERSMGDESVIVAVLDEGIFTAHPDLAASMWVNENEIAGSHEDNDGNGYAGDVHGYNFVKDVGTITTDDYYDSGHGSHVAGVIAAVNNNGVGVSSIAGGDGSKGGVRLMSCQIFSGVTSGNALSAVRAIKYAADNGAVVLQCSWGYVSGSANQYDWGEAGFASQEEWEAGAPLEKDALDYFTHNAGSPNGAIEGGIAVFAGGNESAPQAGYPGASDDYISVAATAADYTAAVYTNFGPGTSISAPGGDQDYYYDYVDDTHNYGELGCILSTLPYFISPSGYGYMEGTSMACPHVSGVVALGISYATQLRRHFKASELQELLLSSATPIDSYQIGTKFYSRYVADIGPVQPNSMDLSLCRGQMGAGQVNAAAFLDAIAGAGSELRFPNLYLAEGGDMAVAPARYFVEGEQLTYTVTIANISVATHSLQGDKLIFKGLKSGATTAAITASNGVKHTFNITVRRMANDNGWL